MQVPNGTGPGVPISDCPHLISACHTLCKCHMEISHNSEKCPSSVIASQFGIKSDRRRAVVVYDQAT